VLPVNGLHGRLVHLAEVWRRRDGSLVMDFEAALADVMALNNPGCIGPLLELFEDEPPSDHLLFSVVHGIEAFPDYVPRLVGGTTALLQRAPRWARILYVRALNCEASRSELSSALRGASEEARVSVSQLLDGIEPSRPELAAKVAEVRRTPSSNGA
jgi:hypothetical protein